jgi:hypothetical protein
MDRTQVLATERSVAERVVDDGIDMADTDAVNPSEFVPESLAAPIDHAEHAVHWDVGLPCGGQRCLHTLDLPADAEHDLLARSPVLPDGVVTHPDLAAPSLRVYDEHTSWSDDKVIDVRSLAGERQVVHRDDAACCLGCEVDRLTGDQLAVSPRPECGFVRGRFELPSAHARGC